MMCKRIVFLLLLVCGNVIYTEAYIKCCPGDNILVNQTCSDGSNITALTCEVKVPMGPSLDPPRLLEIDGGDDTLIITDEKDIGSILIEAENYCMTKESENGTDVALVCYEGDQLTPTGRIVTLYLQIACAFISSVFLLMTFIIYAFVPDLRDTEGKSILNFVGLLLIGHLMLTVGPIILLYKRNACDAVAFINFAAVLCCYNWLCVMSFHVWRITIRPIFQIQMQWFRIYIAYGYGVPIILIVTALLHHFMQEIDPATAQFDCWLSGGFAIWTLFFGPLIIMLIVGIVLLIWAAKKVWIDVDRRDSSPSIVRLRKKCLILIYLTIIMASVAVLDIIYGTILTSEDDILNYVWDMSDCRNLLMGVVIFCILIVMRNKVLKALAKRGLWCMKFPENWKRYVDEEAEGLENEEATLTQYSSGL